jgi:phosphoribosylformylglycinamidine synthase I
VIRTAGTNTDGETVVACDRAGFKTELLHVNRLVEKPERFREYDCFVVPGGFSYGDDLGSGRVFANELRLRLLDPIREFVRAGKFVLGICNGFQVLVKAGLLPDPLAEGPPSVTLTFNDSGRFEDRWIRLKAVSSKCAWVREGEFLETAVTHGEGKFVAPAATLDRLEAAGQVVLKYVDRTGAETGYPANPNGSLRNIAGLCDPTGRVFGLMPHPEKHLDMTNHPRWTRGIEKRPLGLSLFRAAFERLSK